MKQTIFKNKKNFINSIFIRFVFEMNLLFFFLLWRIRMMINVWSDFIGVVMKINHPLHLEKPYQKKQFIIEIEIEYWIQIHLEPRKESSNSISPSASMTSWSIGPIFIQIYSMMQWNMWKGDLQDLRDGVVQVFQDLRSS